MTVTDADLIATCRLLDRIGVPPDAGPEVIATVAAALAAGRAEAETEAERRLDALIEVRAKRDALAAAEQRLRADVLALAEEWEAGAVAPYWIERLRAIAGRHS